MTRPGNKPTRTEVKASQTDAAAREIMTRDAKAQADKTARLRADRLKREAQGTLADDPGNDRGKSGSKP